MDGLDVLSQFLRGLERFTTWRDAILVCLDEPEAAMVVRVRIDRVHVTIRHVSILVLGRAIPS